MDIIQDIENRLLSASYSNDFNTINEIWNEICKDDFLLRDAMIVEYSKRDYYMKDYYFKYPMIVEMMLNNYENISKYTYSEITAIILSNKYLARVRVGDKTYLEKLLMNNNLMLNDEAKKFCEKEALHTYEVKNEYKNVLKPLHSMSAFDLRYYILMNKSFTLEEKKELINLFYTNDKDFYNHFRQWEAHLSSTICNGKYDVNQMYSIGFDELKEFYNSIKIAKRMYNKIQLHSLLGNNPPSVYEAQSYVKRK